MSIIYARREFAALFERERRRSDRNECEFAVITFEIPHCAHCEQVKQKLAGTLQKRIRCSDVLGWIDEQHLGVILPDTSAKGARKLARDVCNAVLSETAVLQYTIFVYPSHWDNNRDPLQNSTTGSSRNMPDGQANHILKKLEPRPPQPIPLWKRIMDIVIACCALLLLLPLFLLIGVCIKVVSPGPVVFKQERVGYRGELFYCWKFRTMHVNADTAAHQNHVTHCINHDISMDKLDDCDQRIVPFGKILRKTGLDELPQLINIIRGEMSLTGPRPCIPYEARLYRPWQLRRFDTLPGLTGLWQVNGKNRTTFNEMMRYDVSYTRKRSIGLDLKILLKTVPAVITQATDKKEKAPQAHAATDHVV